MVVGDFDTHPGEMDGSFLYTHLFLIPLKLLTSACAAPTSTASYIAGLPSAGTYQPGQALQARLRIVIGQALSHDELGGAVRVPVTVATEEKGEILVPGQGGCTRLYEAVRGCTKLVAVPGRRH
jgi:hypothetical protein